MHTDPSVLFNVAQHRLNTEDWNGVADLCDPASLSVFRRDFLWRFTPHQKLDHTVEAYLLGSPDMPREVAEYHVKKLNTACDPMVRFREEIYGAESLEYVQSLPPAELFAAWLQGQSPRSQLERLVESGHMSRAIADAHLPTFIPMWNYTVVGVVMDGDRIAHVLYRSELSPENAAWYEADLIRAGTPEDELELNRDTRARLGPSMMSCRRGPDGGWRLLAGYGFLNIGGNLLWMGNLEGNTAPDVSETDAEA